MAGIYVILSKKVTWSFSVTSGMENAAQKIFLSIDELTGDLKPVSQIRIKII